MQNVNRVLQCIKYAGGMFSGTKSVLCADKITVVGHLCSYEGRKPEIKRYAIVIDWGDCRNLHEVRQFLGMCGMLRMFIKDYAKVLEPINKLTKDESTFEWSKEQKGAMREMKRHLAECAALRPLNYESKGAVILAVDIFWMAVGFGIFQEDEGGSN